MTQHNPITIRAIDHVVIRTADLEKLVGFYRDVLGCAEEKRRDALGLVQLRAGSSLIDLVDTAGEIGIERGRAPDPDAPNMDHFCVQVEPWDSDAITGHLKAHGIGVGDVVTRYGARGHGPSLYIADPDGNIVELKGPPDA